MGPIPIPGDDEAYEIGTVLVSGNGEAVHLTIVLSDALVIKLRLGRIEAQKLAQALNVQVAFDDIPHQVKSEVIE